MAVASRDDQAAHHFDERPDGFGLGSRALSQRREGDKLIDMVLRQPVDERKAVTDVGNAYVASSSGRATP